MDSFLTIQERFLSRRSLRENGCLPPFCSSNPNVLKVIGFCITFLYHGKVFDKYSIIIYLSTIKNISVIFVIVLLN